MKMCHAFASIGHEVHLVVPRNAALAPLDDDDAFRFYGVAQNFRIHQVGRLGIPGGRTWFAFKSALRALRLDADLVYGRFLHGCWASTLLRLDVAYESHAPEREISFLSARLMDRLARSPRLRRLIVITEALKRDHLEQHPQATPKIAVVPDAADEIPAGTTAIDLHAESGRLQVGYVGQLYAGKGMELISTIAPQCPWADFHIVGGSEADIAHWKKQTETLDNVRFHGFVPPAECDRYRLAFDVALAPYQQRVSGHESAIDIGAWMSPLKIFEYMAAATPVVASYLPVLREVLTHGETAILCDPNAPEEWVNALKTLRDDTNLRAAMGRRGHEYFLERYTWKRRAERLLHLTAEKVS